MSRFKRTHIAGYTAAALLIPPLGAQSAATDSAVISIIASVVDNTCTPDWTGVINVPLGRVAARNFTGAGVVGASDTFNLQLKDCGGDATKIKVTAAGNPDDSNPELFKNEASSGAATGVAVAIFGDSTQSTQLKPGSGEAEYDISGNVAPVLTFRAELRQNSDTAPKTGEVQSNVTLTLAYE